MPKNPFQADKIVLKDGGSIETAAGTDIVSVSSAGVPSIKADIQDALASGKIYVGNASGVSAEVAVSGDATLANTGALTIAALAVTSAKLEASLDLSSKTAVLLPDGAQVYLADDGAVGPTMEVFQDSASPAAFDAPAYFAGSGNDDAGNKTVYGRVEIGIGSAADGAEEGLVAINAVTGGSLPSGGSQQLIVSGTKVEAKAPIWESQTEQALSGAGAVDVTSQTTAWDCSGAVAGTLADGSAGQTKRIYCGAYTGNGTLTPSNLLGYSTITFTAVGQCVELYFNGSAWVVASNQGCTLA